MIDGILCLVLYLPCGDAPFLFLFCGDSIITQRDLSSHFNFSVLTYIL